jgi:cobalt-zinc-cadmium efflux system outer membrane protein
VKYILMLCAVVSIAGCASPHDRRSFDDVQTMVLERTGTHVQWNTGSDEDRAAEQAVAQLLSRDLSPDDAVQIALLNNRRIQGTFEELGIAQADLVAAGLLKNPVLDGDVLFSTAGGGTGVELTVLQSFLDVLWIPMRQKVAKASLESVKTRVAAEVIALGGEARRACIELQAAQQLLELRRTVTDATSASYDLARRIHAAGNMTDLDLQSQRALYEQSKLDLASAELEIVESRERLHVLMGVWGAQTQWKTSPRLPDIPQQAVVEETVEQTAIERSLALAAAGQDILRLGEALGITETTALLQDVQIGAKTERDQDGSWGVGPAFSLPIPLFDQGQAGVAAARARLRQAQQQYMVVAVEVRSAARTAVARVRLARDRALYLRQVVLPLQSRIVENSQRQYNAMTISVFQLLQARQEQIGAGAQYVESLRGYWLARSELDLILAGAAGSEQLDITTDQWPSVRPTNRGEH